MEDARRLRGGEFKAGDKINTRVDNGPCLANLEKAQREGSRFMAFNTLLGGVTLQLKNLHYDEPSDSYAVDGVGILTTQNQTVNGIVEATFTSPDGNRQSGTVGLCSLEAADTKFLK